MRILITNNTLALRAGTELYVRDLVAGIAKRGHEPVAYTTRPGVIADEIRSAGLPVITDLSNLSTPPDIIHGHHHLDTMAALLHFPKTPAIYVCHSARAWEEAAPHFPRILRYVAVDHACHERLIKEHRIPEDQIRVVFNFVHLDRFKPRSELPARPRKALILSNQASEYTHVGVVRETCDRAGIRLDVRGSGAGMICAEPEVLLQDYDLVFAKARSALEALAVGAAVITCDEMGVGEMVTTENIERLRPLNFGFRTLSRPLSVAALSGEIARYDSADAARVSQFIRANCGLDATVDELLQLYEEVIDAYRIKQNQDYFAELRAASAYLSGLPAHLHEMGELKDHAAELKLIKSSRSWRLITRYGKVKKKILQIAQRASDKSVAPSAIPKTSSKSPVKDAIKRDLSAISEHRS